MSWDNFLNFAHIAPEASLVVLLTLAVFGVLITRIFKLPSMLAYLSIGLLISATGIDLIPGDNDIREIAEFGIAFLMFSIGLEFSIARLLQMRQKVFTLGPSQMLLTAVGSMLITWLGYDQGWRAGLAVGLAIAMSSTAIMAKLLSENFELHSRHGKRTMAVLLFQDLAVVPSLLIIPALALNEGNLGSALLISLALGIVTLVLMFWIGRKLVNRLFALTARFHSPELFMLTVLWLVFALSFMTNSAGLSEAMGAFIGGILVSETLYRHEVEADIRPFRDVLLGIFFVSIGMMLDVSYVLSHIPIILFGLMLLIAGKAIVTLGIALIFKAPWPVAIRTAAQLAMAGEFGIVLLTLAFNQHLINDEVFQSTLAVMLLSMFVAPFLINAATRIASHVDIKSAPDANSPTLKQHTHQGFVSQLEYDHHVLICGFGRTGHVVAEFLSAENLPWVAIDINANRVQQATHEYGHIIFGRAERPEVLSAAGFRTARLIVICFPDPNSVERMLVALRRTRPDVPIVVRAPDDSFRTRFMNLGATEVIPEVFESGLGIAEETMRQLEIPPEKTRAKVDAIKNARYRSAHSPSSISKA
ncbi:MAG: cation:proton antiporter [Fluviibacter sp.]